MQEGSKKQYKQVYFAFSFTELNTGMSGGEVLTIRRSKIDYVNKRYPVREHIPTGDSQKVNPKPTTLKRKARIRDVEFSDDLLAVLKQLDKSQKEEYLKKGIPDQLPDFLFVSEVGKVINYSLYVRDYFQRVLKRAGVRQVRPHDLRHTYACTLLANGVPITYVSKQLGHASPQITLAIYSRWLPDKKNPDAAKYLPKLRDL